MVNLCAILEKHTKSERVPALTTRASYALVLKQGYRPVQAPEICSGRPVEGVTDPVDLVVLAR